MLGVIVGILAFLGACVVYAEGLSTTQDGNFQAIAQGPSSITVYWRHEGRSSELFIDDRSVGIIEPDPSRPFAHKSLTDLQPNTEYVFSVRETGQTVRERTWSELPEQADYDLLVVGGTSSGVAAAISAAKLGLRVALIEKTNRVGGMIVNGLSSTDMRNASRSNGIFEDFRRRVVEHYGGGSGMRFEPKIAHSIIKEMLYEHPAIDLYLRCEVVNPVVEPAYVHGAIIRDLTTGKTGRINAKISIDATDTGDFAAAAGAEYRVGREPRSPEEPHAGFIYFNNAKQEILPGSTGEGDKKQQSYAYLMIWKDYDDAGAPLIEMPPYYDPEKYRHSPNWEKTWNYSSGKLPNKKFEINQHPFGTDWPNINHDYPTASNERRKEIEDMYKARALGYLYFMQNERGHTNLGLADDEFLDNDNFPIALYVREARRIMGSYLFKENDATCAPEIRRKDAIAIGDYPMDSHATVELTDPNAPHKGEGEMWLVSFTPVYQVPYGVLAPNGIGRLFVSTAVSATHVGYGALRMEPVRFSLGQAAGAAAYWSILYSAPANRLNPAWIQDKILSQDSYIVWYPDVDRETRHFEAIQFLGARGVFFDETFRPNEPITYSEAQEALELLARLEGYSDELIWSPAPSQDALITRGEFAILLVQAKQLVDQDWIWVNPAEPSYSDVPNESPYFAAVETLRAHRISAALFENYQPGYFLPDAPISRADAAEAIYLAHRARAMR